MNEGSKDLNKSSHSKIYQMEEAESLSLEEGAGATDKNKLVPPIKSRQY
jgi:hypothetical protein